MQYKITHSLSPYVKPETVATMDELTSAALVAALVPLPAHAGDVLHFELDADHPGFADAFTDRGEVYSIEPA